MTRDRPALFDGDTGDMPLEARMAAIDTHRAANSTAPENTAHLTTGISFFCSTMTMENTRKSHIIKILVRILFTVNP